MFAWKFRKCPKNVELKWRDNKNESVPIDWSIDWYPDVIAELQVRSTLRKYFWLIVWYPDIRTRLPNR